MFTDKVSTEIIIAAPAEAVWARLTDFASWPEWNPFINQMQLREGQPLAAGSRMDGVFLDQPGGRTHALSNLELITVEASKELVWEGMIFGSQGWLFTGRHAFRLEVLPDGATKLINEEDMGGWLVPVMRVAGVVGNVGKQFEAMNEALKQRAEGTN